MHRIILASVILLSACGGGAGTHAQPDVQTVRVVGPGGGTLRVRPDGGTTTAIVGLPLEQVWRMLPAVFDSLDVPVTRVDEAARLYGNDGFRLRRRLGGVLLSRYFDCGETQIGPNADSYDVFLLLLTRLRPAPGNMTTVDVTVEARARPVAFRQNYAGCTTRGRLEPLILELLTRVSP